MYVCTLLLSTELLTLFFIKAMISSSALLSIKPPLLPRFTSSFLNPRVSDLKPNQRWKNRNFECRAEFTVDAPFAVAIGGCILNSLVFPVKDGPDEDGGESALDSTDSRFAVMGIISLIPYFNWLSWIFAWMDTGRQRYLVYSIVYLAPYLRTNLSLSPDESWLPIASIVLCIIHIQLEASIRNRDIQGFQLFSEGSKNLSSLTKKKDARFKDHQRTPKKGMKKGKTELPPAQEQSRNELRGWGIPKKPLDDVPEQLNEDGDANKTRKH